jgi:hypothetical protein
MCNDGVTSDPKEVKDCLKQQGDHIIFNGLRGNNNSVATFSARGRRNGIIISPNPENLLL